MTVTDNVFVYEFSEGSGASNELLGGKGAGLAAMSGLGLPVPPGFTITTEACRAYMEAGDLPGEVAGQVGEHLGKLEESIGKRLGETRDPLLVSVRSGAAVSMPGMMDTVLNLGLNDAAVEGFAGSTGDERFAYDSYRRFIQMFGDVVLKVEHEKFEAALEVLKEERGAEDDTGLSAGDLKGLIQDYKKIVEDETGGQFPQEPREQLDLAIRAVFDSWNNPRAISYRKEFGLPDDLGTAVTVQGMVFGNMGETSATGVVFTRDPSTGEQGLFGEFLMNAQGEDVVAGIRTPRPIAEMEEFLPHAFGELLETMQRLENEYRDMQDIEFTVERDKLFMLQTRSGKRTAIAALKIAREMADEGIISREEAVMRIDPRQLNQVLHPYIDPEADLEVLAEGLPASPGAATGKIVFTADEAAERGGAGESVILVRKETTPDDVHGMVCARGTLTALGGMTSHAAVVARGMGIPAVTGCKALKIDPVARELGIDGKTFGVDDSITIEGSTGRVVEGEAPLVDAETSEDFEQVLAWADEFRTLGVRANADTPKDAEKARQLGAGGIGLCRTEHMFMEDGRLEIVREMILSDTEEATAQALASLAPLQRGDFEGIFRAMDGLPVTIRLLDPPLHEFLPNSLELYGRLAELDDGDSEEASEIRRQLRVVESLEEANPMLGLRGCRLGIVRPGLYRMQVRAIAEAAKAVKEEGHDPIAEIMVPLVGFRPELAKIREEISAVVEEVLGPEAPVRIGTMIELPRACAVADKIAGEADFFSFGTNDLTQTTCGLSRDDAEGAFLAQYLEGGILSRNPFETIDVDGVGRLVSMACAKGREANPGLKLGICGEHGGDPESIKFFHETGLDYVSCSPYRVPVARLAAAQADLDLA
ncbi:MAG: Pyruvate,phosphate dikinase [uncultured Rubrobacteraceae bacterium]|uniref:Pyruvate, phosphate dikinase n=1 Tax=uncultured Rubrobacteraceae bacterium TaxID=349277 RepID=A0A6J4NPP8_9ACTN|nr:MAG: Pyruvate,phosphate dikinase [uncultured Rubrobacteraceae bacterium]